jgi:putative FmdB family regulatory protein
MPTYEYECPKCEHRFEKFQSMSDPPVKTCPECGGRKVKRLIGTGAGLLFKGSGFYKTDYRSDSYKKEAKADSGETKAPAKEPKKKNKAKSEKKASGGSSKKSEGSP